MGIDTLELHLSLEREFHVRIPNDNLGGLWKDRRDFQVRDLVAALEQIVQRDNPAYSRDIALATIQALSQFTGIEESQISLDSWFIRDLGLD